MAAEPAPPLAADREGNRLPLQRLGRDRCEGSGWLATAFGRPMRLPLPRCPYSQPGIGTAKTAASCWLAGHPASAMPTSSLNFRLICG